MNNPRLEILRTLTPESFCPRITVRKDGEAWFSFSVELIQYIQHGDWAGMFGPAQRTKTLIETFRTICLAYQNEFPEDKELVAEAMEMIMEAYVKRVNAERDDYDPFTTDRVNRTV